MSCSTVRHRTLYIIQNQEMNQTNEASLSMTLDKKRLDETFNHSYWANLKQSGMHEAAQKYKDLFNKNTDTSEFAREVQRMQENIDKAKMEGYKQQAEEELKRKEAMEMIQEKRKDELKEEPVVEEKEKTVNDGEHSVTILKWLLEWVGVKVHHKMWEGKIRELAKENGLL